MRLPNYQSNLHSLIARWEARPFAWGSADCAIFGADAIQALTGDDPAASYRGKYKTLAGGLRAIRKSGFNDQIDYLSKTFSQIPLSMATMGDLAVIETDLIGPNGMGQSVALIAGQFVIGLGPDGLVRLPIDVVKNVYRVE